MSTAQILAAAPTGRRPETTIELVARAYDLIDRYGLAGRHAGYGSYTDGLSIEGAVYDALGLREDFFNLSEAPAVVYRRADDAFLLLAAALGTPGLKPGRAQALVIRTSQDWASESRYGSGRGQALELLATVFAELTEAAA
jgi:hypothetical protein